MMVLFYINLFFFQNAFASEVVFLKKLLHEVLIFYNGQKIEKIGKINWTYGDFFLNPKKITILGEVSPGNVKFAIFGDEKNKYSEGCFLVSVWALAKVSNKKIKPGEKLKNEFFSLKNIEISRLKMPESRRYILNVNQDLENLEAVQTILEGDLLLSSSVKKIPDVRRGELVNVRLSSGNVTLSVPGISEDFGYLNDKIKVITSKAKKQFSGYLSPGGVVEVQL